MATKVIPTTRTDGGWHQKPFADKSMALEVQADLAKESKREARGVSWDLHQRECDKNEALEYEIETLKAKVAELELRSQFFETTGTDEDWKLALNSFNAHKKANGL